MRKHSIVVLHGTVGAIWMCFACAMTISNRGAHDNPPHLRRCQPASLFVFRLGRINLWPKGAEVFWWFCSFYSCEADQIKRPQQLANSSTVQFRPQMFSLKQSRWLLDVPAVKSRCLLATATFSFLATISTRASAGSFSIGEEVASGTCSNPSSDACRNVAVNQVQSFVTDLLRLPSPLSTSPAHLDSSAAVALLLNRNVTVWN